MKTHPSDGRQTPAHPCLGPDVAPRPCVPGGGPAEPCDPAQVTHASSVLRQDSQENWKEGGDQRGEEKSPGEKPQGDGPASSPGLCLVGGFTGVPPPLGYRCVCPWGLLVSNRGILGPSVLETEVIRLAPVPAFPVLLRGKVIYSCGWGKGSRGEGRSEGRGAGRCRERREEWKRVALAVPAPCASLLH